MNTNIRPDILNHLKKDKKLAVLVDQCTINIHKEPVKVFDDLIRSIISQQLSTAAASTIYNRFIQSLDSEYPSQEQILQKNPEELRACGISFQKVAYIKNVANHFDTFNLHDMNWDSWTDEDIITELTKIKGVGRWTVEMILMFSLFREDVLPLDDLIIRNNMINLYNVTAQKKELYKVLTEIAEEWRPYRTYACRYLWAAKDMQLFVK